MIFNQIWDRLGLRVSCQTISLHGDSDNSSGHPLTCFLSPLPFTEKEPLELKIGLSVSSSPAEPPGGIPCAFIEGINLVFVFSNGKILDLGDKLPAEEQILQTSFSNKSYIQSSREMPRMSSDPTLVSHNYDFPELCRNAEEQDGVELLSFFQNDIHPLWEELDVDSLPYRSMGELHAAIPEAVRAPLHPHLGEVDSKHILRLADAGLQSIFLNGERQGATDVHLSNAGSGLKLSEISPALFRPGYIQVGSYDLEL